MDLRIITEDFPVIHINGSTIDGKLEAHLTNEVLDHPDGSVTWDKLSTDVKETIDAKANAPHTHQTSDIYSTAVVAYDLSSYMGGWEIDGIAIGVANKEDFLALGKFYMTYGDTVIETKPSSFTDWKSTAAEAWNGVEERYADLNVFIYKNTEFDPATHEPKPLNPIFRKNSLDDWYIGVVKALYDRYTKSETGALFDAFSQSLIKNLISKNTIGTYCLRNLVAGITSQLYVAIAYPIPGVAKYALIVNGKQLGETTSVGQPLKIASILSTTTKSYLCFMDVVNNPIFYAQMNDGIENSAFTTGVLLHFVPTDPWKPEGGTKVPEAGEDFE